MEGFNWIWQGVLVNLVLWWNNFWTWLLVNWILVVHQVLHHGTYFLIRLIQRMTSLTSTRLHISWSLRISNYYFLFRGDSTKDDKFGTLNSYQNSLVELAAHVLYRVPVLYSIYFVPHNRIPTQPTVFYFTFQQCPDFALSTFATFFINSHYDLLKQFCSGLTFDFCTLRIVVFSIQSIEIPSHKCVCAHTLVYPWICVCVPCV